MCSYVCLFIVNRVGGCILWSDYLDSLVIFEDNGEGEGIDRTCRISRERSEENEEFGNHV